MSHLKLENSEGFLDLTFAPKLATMTDFLGAEDPKEKMPTDFTFYHTEGETETKPTES